jgi:hypothetical protein
MLLARSVLARHALAAQAEDGVADASATSTNVLSSSLHNRQLFKHLWCLFA